MSLSPQRLQRLQRVRAVREEFARAEWLAADAELARANERWLAARAEVRAVLDGLAASRERNECDVASELLAQSLQAPLEARANTARVKRQRTGELERASNATWRSARADLRALVELERRASDEAARETADKEQRELEELCARSAPPEIHR